MFSNRLCSGYPYPVPWWLILLNVYLTIALALAFMFGPTIREIRRYRNIHGIPGPVPNPVSEASEKVPLLLQTSPASDFPSVLPPHVSHCGPIVGPCTSISTENPELATWLSQRPTVLINMGSLVTFNDDAVCQFAKGLNMLLNRRPDIQILWKLQHDRSVPRWRLDWVSKDLFRGRVWIEEWLPVEPICILLSGHVNCVVHHGGSNSYHEAIR